MPSQFTLVDFAISVAVKKFNPVALSPDFLQYSNIIPEDWEVARPPVYSKQVVQIVFKNGVRIVGQPNRLTFIEAVDMKALNELIVADLAQRCMNALPKLAYQAVEFKPRG